ncbi:hypothetical protein SHKM778_18510 [Streptomyces sp. KM77-8]|uniref:Peptidase S8/S53 domain-containing protein n=1 Tax=Streptomyces haneummycinicus TaxID=3074435 RepID=A0AAT9HE38_9ACTN
MVDFGPSGVRQKSAPPAYRPALSAPGSEMVSVAPEGSGHYIGSGASLAAAAVAGAAALVRAYHPDLTAPEVTRRLLDTAYPSDIPRLDPYASLSLLQDRTTSHAAPEAPAEMPPPPNPAPEPAPSPSRRQPWQRSSSSRPWQR